MSTTRLLRPAALALTALLLFTSIQTPASAQGTVLAAAPTTQSGTAPPAPDLPTLRLDDVESGTLLLKTDEPGLFLEAPRVATDVSIDVSGLIVRATVTQRFENPTDGWVEGTYVYPLPNEAGVDRLRMMVGERFIEGRIEERAAARRIYEEARDAGVRAALVEQERPNMFTNSVANIGPHETVIVQIEYQEIARLEDGAFGFRLPLVVGPRYIPAPDLIQTVDLDATTGFAIHDPVPDRDRITPAVMHPALEPGMAEGMDPQGELRLPVSISVNLRAGFPLGEVTSPYHDVVVEMREDGTGAALALADGPVPANRDFVLSWRPANDTVPNAAAFTETGPDGTYLLAMVVPPAELGVDAPRLPREAIFVIDSSGSMAGPSMPQAKAALLMALDRLQPDDTFNVVRFSDTLTVLFPTAVPATFGNVERAKGYVEALEANGGTEMLPALQAALIDRNPSDATRVRQVLFLTDGAIGNEAEMFEAIDDGLGRSRLFTVGIGTAPNTYFMARAARLGRGTFTHIGDLEEVQEKSEILFAALEQPVMTDLAVDLPVGVQGEVWPNPMPDLYAGEPVVLTARIAASQGTMRITGQLSGRRWAADLDFAGAAQGQGVVQAWARQKVEAIEERRFTGSHQSEIDDLVLETALKFSLVSRLTSLVAVDVTPARPAGLELASLDVPTMLPEGWDFGRVVGDDFMPVNAPLTREASLDPALLDRSLPETPSPTDPAAAPVQQPTPQAVTPSATAIAPRSTGIALPAGATTAELQMLLGLTLILASIAWLAWSRRTARVRRG